MKSIIFFLYCVYFMRHFFFLVSDLLNDIGAHAKVVLERMWKL